MRREAEKFNKQLRRAGRLTKVRWAAWVVPKNGSWEVLFSWGVTQRRNKRLRMYLQQRRWTTWLAGALANERRRSRRVEDGDEVLLGGRLYVFPVQASRGVLLVGADDLTEYNRHVWSVVALGAPSPDLLAAHLLAAQRDAETDAKMPSMCARLTTRLGDSGYRPQQVAEAIVVSIPEMIACERVYLAVLEGKTWRVLSAWGKNVKTLPYQSLDMAAMPDLQPLTRGQAVALEQEPWPNLSTPQPWHWLGLPFVRGKHVLGMLAVGRQEEAFRQAEREHLTRVLDLVAWVLENAFSLEEIGEHLRRKAVINDVFLSVLSSDNVTEAARNATRYLRRVMQADVAMVLLPESDGTLQVLGVSPEDFRERSLPIRESLCGYVFETGKRARFGDVHNAPRYYPLSEGVKSELCVPMRSRQEIIGVINLESSRANAFDEDDERLLIGVAGQLALLLETVRLRHDIAARARRMELVHQVVRDVVGLLDEQQVVSHAAERIADYFGFEVTMVIVFDPEQEKRQVLFRKAAGSGVQTLDQLSGVACPPKSEGIIGYVLRTGKSVLVNDTQSDERFVPFPGFEALSELCVPLFSHDEDNRVIGVIDIERGVKDAFTEEDQLALEAISGVLSAVLANARRYRRLNTTVSHLDAARATALDIIADLKMETLLQRIVSRVRYLLNAKGAEIGLLDIEAGVVRIVATENPWRDYTGYTFSIGKGVSGRVAATGRTEIIDDYYAWEGRGPSALPAAFRAVASVPLRFHDEVVGVLTVYDDREGRRFTKDEVALLELLAPQIAIAIRNARLYQELGERIEAQRKAEHGLVQSARLAAVGEMAAAVAHELNSPLTTVMGFVELALEDLTPHSKTYEDLELVLQEARRARDIVRRLLDFARRTEPMPIATDINMLINETLALVSHLIMTSGVMMEVTLEDELPLVLVDRTEMKQVFLNLIHNALQAMPRGGQLRISTALVEDTWGRWVTIDVEDNGVGMSPEQQMRIFEPFYTTGGGTGMGLSVSYSIVQKHGGNISVQSQEGKGSTFSVRLPVP